MSDARRCLVCETEGPFDVIFRQGPHTLVRCPACELVFQEPQPTPEQLETIYGEDDDFVDQLEGPLRGLTLERARERLSLLESVTHVEPGGRALDVGCATGAWLEVAEAAGWTGTGVEVGRSQAEAARRRGLDVRTGTLEEIAPDLDGPGFDLITFWDVLEHMPDPRTNLELARGLLAPGGVIGMTFPNVEGLYPQLTYRLLTTRTGVWEHPHLPRHLYDFSPSTVSRLLERSGLRVRGVQTFTIGFENYLQTSLSPAVLGTDRGARKLRLAFGALRLVAYPVARLLDRGNGLFVAAERTT